MKARVSAPSASAFAKALAIATLASIPSAHAAPAATDLNGDHVVDAKDAQAFLASVAAGTPLPNSLDLDGDGKVGLADALLFGRWVNGLYVNPAAGLTSLYFSSPADSAAYANYAADKKAKAAWTLADLKQHYPSAPAPDPDYAGTIQYAAEAATAMAAWAPKDWDKGSFFSAVRARGSAVSEAVSFPNYFQAFDRIHQADLPMLFTTDALLHTAYLSYDNILMELEEKLFAPSLEKILLASYGYADKAYGGSENGADVKDMLATALLLLDRTRSDVDATADINVRLRAVDLLARAGIKLNGVDTTVDFSQFQPRGHYTRSETLKAYFRAMLWLSRADLAFDLRRQSKGKTNPSFTRMKKDALVLWDCVVNSGSYPAWLEINRYLEYLVGMSDGLNMRGMGTVAQKLGIENVPAFVAAFPEARFDSVLAAEKLGAQAILSQAKSYETTTDDLDLSPICNFMPQRFILDSYTFSQLVYPITEELMPSSQQIAFALGDNSALGNLPPAGGGKVYGVLGAQRSLYDGITPEGWQSNMYTSWLGFLRKLNPGDANAKAAPAFRTASWLRKMRNTQLTSWAQLRHNTILYAKQSYTGGILCSFPKAYVEPYPDFFAAVAAYARIGSATFKKDRPAVAAYFSELEVTAGKLAEIAARSAQGLGPTEAQGDWITTALSSKSVPAGCTSVRVYDGWYVRLIYSPKSGLEEATDFTIADVHTHLRDVAGPDMVLHEASGAINIAAVAVQEDSCVTMYVGPVGSFYEVLRKGDLKRYNDDEWTQSVTKKDSLTTRPAWTRPMLAP